MGMSVYYSCTETCLACRCGCGSAGKTAACQMKKAKTASGRLLFGLYFEAVIPELSSQEPISSNSP